VALLRRELVSLVDRRPGTDARATSAGPSFPSGTAGRIPCDRAARARIDPGRPRRRAPSAGGRAASPSSHWRGRRRQSSRRGRTELLAQRVELAFGIDDEVLHFPERLFQELTQRARLATAAVRLDEHAETPSADRGRPGVGRGRDRDRREPELSSGWNEEGLPGRRQSPGGRLTRALPTARGAARTSDRRRRLRLGRWAAVGCDGFGRSWCRWLAAPPAGRSRSRRRMISSPRSS
jgi:hypothetical protein